MLVRTSEDIAKIVKNERIRQGFTQIKLARLCGVGTRFLLELEKGKPTCQMDKVLKVIVGLGIVLKYE